ncbi:hypothetical protein [Pseudoxanthomonas suwonensis]|uniref:Uncharacterized protein n=1 Tax=Pseudoxanthomonas suwonensis TaxID=314722 RepID=A0A0E3UP93_9GAMM|nr:hypothetical protein [Pseudoxanthomonas suwonensis]AKC87871.1 hypothetical protein WQ53_14975 [Pseudoxanthomonas suwonensis]
MERGITRAASRIRRIAGSSLLLVLALAAGAPAGATTVAVPLLHNNGAAAEVRSEPDPAVRGEGVLVDSAAVRDVFDPLPGVSAQGGAEWRAAVATLPDPVESRLARSFDIEVATLVRSFQFAGYVLQGHAMPWPEAGAKADEPSSRPYRGTPGVLVFRHDAWREEGNVGPRTRYFVLYLVGESPTFGVQRLAFCRATRQALALNDGGERPARDDGEAGCMAPRTGADPSATPAQVSVLGPTFSGSLASIASVARQAGLHLDLMSPSATVTSNRHIAERDPGGRHSIGYRTFAQWDQVQQMAHLFAYLETVHGICPGDVVVLSEESAFGQGSQETEKQLAGERAAAEAMGAPAPACLDRSQPTYLQFPQNISAIRAEHANLDRETAKNPQLTPRRFLELDMRDAGTGLDLPPVYQPQLSTRSDELSLQQLMDTLNVYVRPRAVMVVATDVRDRLFMLAVVRRTVPGAIPVVLEGDHLLTHPDYRRANRGTLMVANGRMQACYVQVAEGGRQYRTECRPRQGGGEREVVPGSRRIFAFPTDYAANLFRASQELLSAPATAQADASAAAAQPRRGRSPLSVVTLAGIQWIDPDSYVRSDGGNGTPQATAAADSTERRRSHPRSTLIAADFRVLSLNVVLPLLVAASGLALAASGWLLLSSRPGRTVLPPVRYALRETGWALDRMLRRRGSGREEQAARLPAPGRRRHSTGALSCALLGLLALATLLLFATRWGHLLLTEQFRGAMRGALDLIHGRDRFMLWAMFGLYLWFACLVMTRLRAWNRRCVFHLLQAPAAFDAGRYLGRRYTLSSLLLATAAAVPPLAYWGSRLPDAVDGARMPGALALAMLGLGVFFLSQALLQNGRLVRLGRDLRDHVLERLPDGALPADWPNPQWLGTSPRSPLAAIFHDNDWLALDRGDDRWPAVDPAELQAALDQPDPRDRLPCWRAQTVAEMKFGLTCVRSCLWAAFAAPAVLLAMQEVFPFALEFEQSAVALGLMTVAFVASAWLSISLERAPLVGQMFTKDAHHVSLMDLLRILGTKLLLLLLMLAATLTPNLGEWLQNLVGVLRL